MRSGSRGAVRRWRGGPSFTALFVCLFVLISLELVTSPIWWLNTVSSEICARSERVELQPEAKHSSCLPGGFLDNHFQDFYSRECDVFVGGRKKKQKRQHCGEIQKKLLCVCLTVWTAPSDLTFEPHRRGKFKGTLNRKSPIIWGRRAKQESWHPPPSSPHLLCLCCSHFIVSWSCSSKPHIHTYVFICCMLLTQSTIQWLAKLFSCAFFLLKQQWLSCCECCDCR